MVNTCCVKLPFDRKTRFKATLSPVLGLLLMKPCSFLSCSDECLHLHQGAGHRCGTQAGVCLVMPSSWLCHPPLGLSAPDRAHSSGLGMTELNTALFLFECLQS